jgi:O-antigen/teichoic acid export membrane protein
MVLTMGTGILLATGDRWVVALWGGSTMLGYYAFAGSLTTAAAALALVVRTVVFPQVYGEASSAGAAAALQSHLERALLPFAWLLPPLLGAASLALGPIVAGAIPTYLEAVAPARLFLLSGAAMGLVNLASIGAVAAGQQRRLPLYAASGLALTCALSVAALASGYGLGAVAGATFAGHLLFAALVLRLNVQEAGVPRVERFVAAILLPLVWCTVAVSITGALFPAADSLSAVLALGVYLLLLLPLASRWKEEWRRLQR